jgi:hypothetical protein
MRLPFREHPSIRLRRALESATPRSLARPSRWQRCVRACERGWFGLSLMLFAVYVADQLRPMTARDGILLSSLIRLKSDQTGAPPAEIWAKLAAEHGFRNPQTLTKWQAEELETELIHCVKTSREF